MLPPEDAARAGIYAFLARLFRSPPEPALLEAIGESDEVATDGNGILEPWVELAYAAAATDFESVCSDYESAFLRRERSRTTVTRFCDGCETLRDLIVRGQTDLAGQRRFFRQRLLPAAAALHRSMGEARASRFYRHLERFAVAFLRVEGEAFDLPDHC